MHYEYGRKAAADSGKRKGFLARLARDVRGNTLAIVGAALVPLSAMIGSGVDMSRAYMAKSRLQAACDAAALAGRRIMQNDTLDDNVRNEAERFFDFNFNEGLYRTDPFDPVVTRPTSGTVRVAASTRIPTTIMSMFGFETLPLNVTCEASLNFVNTDIMLVLDTTGSMNEDVNGNWTWNDSARKITALRAAVLALYDELEPVQTQLASNGLRLRYGIVPYSTTVNVGSLVRAVNPAYLADSSSYSSRVANYTTLQSTNSSVGPYWEYYTTSSPYYTSNPNLGTSISSSNCDKFNKNQNFTGFTATSPLSGGGPAPTPTWTRTFPYDNNITTGGSSGEHGWSGAPDNSGSSRTCRRKRTDTTTTYRYTYTNDTFQTELVDTSQYKLGNPVNVAVDSDSDDNDDDSYAGTVATSGSYDLVQLAAAGTGVGTTSVTWNGCIEERDTVSSITENDGYDIPSGAYDLNINLIPYNDATRWRPQWPRLIWNRQSTTSGSEFDYENDSPCPDEARRLQAWTRSAMETYVNGLTPVGNTYHDSGMIWGARMLSNAGIFADSPDTYNAMPVSRHIIFMTDGVMMPDDEVNSIYGVEEMDRRITGNAGPSQMTARHIQRFKMMCNAAKSMNISIWVIAFGSTLQDHLLECASNANQASVASSQAELIARFREIGSNIGALRLTQ